MHGEGWQRWRWCQPGEWSRCRRGGPGQQQQQQQEQQENEAGEGTKATRPSAGAKRRSALSDMTNVQGGAEEGAEASKGRAAKVARLEAPGRLRAEAQAVPEMAMPWRRSQLRQGSRWRRAQPATASAVADMSRSLGGAGRVRALGMLLLLLLLLRSHPQPSSVLDLSLSLISYFV